MKKRALIYIALAGIFWGTTGVFSHYLRPFGFDSAQLTTFRGVVSLVCMLTFLLCTNPKLLRTPLKELPFLIGSGVGLFLTSAAFFASSSVSSVSSAVILMYTAPIFVLIYSVTFLGEKLNKIKSISIFLMIIGCALVSGVVGGAKFSLWGIIWGLVSGIAYSAYNIFTKILTIHKVPALTVTSYNFIVVSVLGLCISNPVEMVQLSVKSPYVTIPLIIGLGVCSCVLPYLFYTLGLQHIPAGTASALAILEPLSATVFSVALLGEKLTLPLIIGIILVLGAVFALAKQE